MPEYLFIGGPADGMRINIAPDENFAVLSDEQLPADIPGCRIYERTKVSIIKSVRDIEVFVWDSQPQSFALDRLVNCYPRKEVPHV